MDIATIILIGVPIIVWLWIATIAIISVKNDSSLEVFQRTSQIIIVLILPLLGAAIVLHLVNQHSPEVIPKSNIPWPFKFILFGKETPKNKNRNSDEESGIDLAISRRQDRRHETEVIIDGD